MENLSDYATRHQKLTVAQKVERELTYVTEAMGLDTFQQKHWRYKLKREYEAQEKTRLRLEKLQARKEFRKLLKKSDIQKTLEQIEDYSAFYENDENDVQQQTDDEESTDEMLGVFSSERERNFYNDGEDIDFVRHHKRTTKNFHERL